MVKVNAKELHNILIKKKLIGSKGIISFKLAGVSMTVKTRDVGGNIIQGWIGEWMKGEKIVCEEPENTQEFPDFYLDPEDKKNNLLEIKSFDDNKDANFDVANFQAYCRSLKTNAHRLDADYIIFSYIMDEKGIITIKNIWLKKIWEICGPSEAYPIKTQQKQKVIYNIRPIVWYSTGSSKYKPFRTRKDFVIALYKTLLKYPKTKEESGDWLEEVEENYLEYIGNKL